MLLEERHSREAFPVACRVVGSDQWLVAHFDESWKVADVKRYILTKVDSTETGSSLFHPPRNRPVSPITFASIRHSHHGDTDDPDADDDDYDDDYSVYSNDDLVPPDGPRGRGRTHRLGGTFSFDSPNALHDLHDPSSIHRHTLLMFSTGQVLEDDFTLAWYNLRDNELLELHPLHTIVRLPRSTLLDYVQPYFECRVNALRVISTEDRPRTDPKGKRRDGLPEPRSPGDRDRDRSGPIPRRRKKTKLEWKERWLVVYQGQLSLFKHRSDPTLVHSCTLDALTKISRPNEVLGTQGSSSHGAYVVCARFCTLEPPAPPPPPRSPLFESWTDPWSGTSIPPVPAERDELGSPRPADARDRALSAGSVQPRTAAAMDVWDPPPRESPPTGPTGFWYDSSDGDGIWLIVDTLAPVAHANLLRILHRHTPATLSSSVVPADTLPNNPTTPPAPHARAQSPSLAPPPLPYPDWRLAVARRAQRAGLGDLTRAHAYLLYGASKPRVPAPPRETGFDSSARFEDTPPVELEWANWARDLARQARAPANTGPAQPSPPSPPPAQSHVVSARRGSATAPPFSDLAPWPSAGLTRASPPPPPSDFSAASLISSYEDALSPDAPALLVARPVNAGITTSVVSVGRGWAAVAAAGAGAGAERRRAGDKDRDGDGPRLARRKTSNAPPPAQVQSSSAAGAGGSGQGQGQGRGERERERTATRILKGLRPERLVKQFDSAMEFVDGKR
ncbi:hypothetical protein K488DRAFT_87653 [Vararia minispora EC-137]|uniref:Uncharacterized protein n=1 Tax=Vararia minispora EC-137 TaxID=1314806 RepID=A0ACB8QG32_9AGAM|nr:hypothetical protein K488DRAFT_87653 [Vararia minispora EC-137]